eukprot:1154795-Pelagomonas_calceolata.AAC.1
MFNKNIDLHCAAEEALKPCLAGMARVRTLHINTSSPLSCLSKAFKDICRPGRHVCQSDLGHSLSSTGNEMDICIQKWLLKFLKSVFGVRSSTPSWSLKCECGIEPIQFNCFRACARLSKNPSCWTSHVLFTMNGHTCILLLWQSRQSVNAYEIMRKRYTIKVRWSKRMRTQRQREVFLNSSYVKNLDVHAMLRRPKNIYCTPLAQTVWDPYLSAQFCPHAAAQVARAGVGLSARNTAVPLGRDHNTELMDSMLAGEDQSQADQPN